MIDAALSTVGHFLGAARMPAVTGEFQGFCGVMAIFAAILAVAVMGHAAVACRMGALSNLGHGFRPPRWVPHGTGQSSGSGAGKTGFGSNNLDRDPAPGSQAPCAKPRTQHSIQLRNRLKTSSTGWFPVG